MEQPLSWCWHNDYQQAAYKPSDSIASGNWDVLAKFDQRTKKPGLMTSVQALFLKFVVSVFSEYVVDSNWEGRGWIEICCFMVFGE